MRRYLTRLLGLSLAVAALFLYVNSTGDDESNAPDPAGELHCPAGGHIAGAFATAPPSTKETRTPEQIATVWAKSRSEELVAGLRRVYSSDTRVDIGFDSKAQTVAVLTFRSDPALGWHLEAVVACQ